MQSSIMFKPKYDSNGYTTQDHYEQSINALSDTKDDEDDLSEFVYRCALQKRNVLKRKFDVMECGYDLDDY